jgi:FkbM family methyltransferase
MQVPAKLKRLVYPARGGLTRLRFRIDDDWLEALVPDDETFGLSRELILQRVYDVFGPPATGTVIDAGAHVGLFSLIAAQHAECVVALEPDPINRDVLALNRRLNRSDRIVIEPAALWSQDGEMPFRTSWHSTGGRVGSDGELRVRTRSLDSLIAEHGDVDLLKLDIEGAEFEVLPAARQLRRVARIVAELHVGDDGEDRPIVRALEASGFHVRLIDAPSLYTRGWIRHVLRNWRSLQGQRKIKLGLLLYLLLPVSKPRRPPGGRDMPLLVAERQPAAVARRATLSALGR